MCLDCLCGFHAHSLEWEDCFGPIWAGKVNVVIVASDHNLMLLQLALQSSTAEHMTGKQAATRLLSMQLVPFHSIASRVTCEIQRVSFRAAEQKNAFCFETQFCMLLCLFGSPPQSCCLACLMSIRRSSLVVMLSCWSSPVERLGLCSLEHCS